MKMSQRLRSTAWSNVHLSKVIVDSISVLKRGVVGFLRKLPVQTNAAQIIIFQNGHDFHLLVEIINNFYTEFHL